MSETIHLLHVDGDTDHSPQAVELIRFPHDEVMALFTIRDEDSRATFQDWLTRERVEAIRNMLTHTLEAWPS